MKIILFKSILKISQLFSLQTNRKLAVILATIVWTLSKKNKNVTIKNIVNCYPDLTHNEQMKLAKDSFNSSFKNILELGHLWKQGTSVEQIVEKIYGLDDFAKALAEQKGLLLAVPHMANWEVFNLILSKFDKFAFLYKPPNDKEVEDLLIKYRGKTKAKQIRANRKGVREIMMHLKAKGFVTILPDQRPKEGQGIFAPFYGIQTYTMTLFSRLANKTKVPVFFAYVIRTKKGFKVHFEKSDERIYANIEESVSYLNEKIQKIVDKAPEQYQWTYKRFSIQPDNQVPFY